MHCCICSFGETLFLFFSTRGRYPFLLCFGNAYCPFALGPHTDARGHSWDRPDHFGVPLCTPALGCPCCMVFRFRSVRCALVASHLRAEGSASGLRPMGVYTLTPSVWGGHVQRARSSLRFLGITPCHVAPPLFVFAVRHHGAMQCVSRA